MTPEELVEWSLALGLAGAVILVFVVACLSIWSVFK